MVEAANKVDLRNYPKSVTAQAQETYENGDATVSIFSAKDHDEARQLAERIADERLERLARKAIDINDEHSDKYWEFWKLFIPAARLNGKWDGELVGGKLKQKAYNTLVQIKTNTPVDPLNIPKFTRDINQIMDGGLGRKSCSLSKTEISKLAKEVFGSVGGKRQVLFTIIPEDMYANISVYKANIDSAKYDSLPDERGNFTGLELKSYEMPKAYKTLVQTLVDGKKNMSGKETRKFLETVKALETTNAFRKSQQKGSANAKKEDVDIFDLSGDGLLNRGDISAIELFIKMETNAEFKRNLLALKDEDWTSLKALRDVSGLTDKNARELFDLDGNGNVNQKDLDFCKKLYSNINKFDINGDEFVDAQDITLLKEYFKAILQRAKEDKVFRRNTEEIVGTPIQMENLQKKIYR